jgi:hypothetical protein
MGETSIAGILQKFFGIWTKEEETMSHKKNALRWCWLKCQSCSTCRYN